MTLPIPLLILLLDGPSLLAREPVADLHDVPLKNLFTVTNGAAESRGRVFQWTIPRGQTSTLALSPSCPLLPRLRLYDRLLFDYRITQGRIQFLFNVTAYGIRPGPRQAKALQWHVALPTTPRQPWRPVQIEFDLPAWMPFDNPDGEASDTWLNLSVGAGSEDLVLELRDMKLVADSLYVKPWWLSPVSLPVRTAEGYTLEVAVTNLGPGKRKVRAGIRSRHDAFQVAVDPQEAQLTPFGRQAFKVQARLTRPDAPELHEEDVLVAFVPEDAPDAAVFARGWLVKPLKPGGRHQVIFSSEELQVLREMRTRPDVRQWLHLDDRVKNTDRLLGVRLDAIPGTRAWSHSGYSGDLCPKKDGKLLIGSFMPEVVCPQCGLREVGTPVAATVWKLWLGSDTSGRGVLDDLGLLYLLTGDEKYARKGIELLLLYAQQYESLPWTDMLNEPPHYRGNYLLCASRVAHSSTYGTNFLLKGHFRLLNLISESPSWTEEERERVYRGFVIPAAAELAKFPGGLFNMTDITNYDLILAGLSCQDANILYRGLGYDSGLLQRLTDIKPDGFSSEGRPLNYHFASMAEYITSVPLVRNSGLNVSIPSEALKTAVRMPFERATLSGYVPTTGDSACGGSVSPHPLCDTVYDLFPEEAWLYETGTRSTVRTFLRSLTEGPPKPEAWRKHLKTEPTLFPHAGFAILRSGLKPEDQVFLTFDYGENPMHAALDRLQFTLWAFGRAFSLGPGSTYNAATNFKRGDPKALAFVSHGSLGHNVVLADGSDQTAAIGGLTHWHAGEGCQAAAARVEGHYPGVTHQRALALIRGLVVVLDDLASSSAHTYDFAYHNFGTLAAGPGWKATPEETPLGDKANYSNIRALCRLEGRGDLRLSWDLGQGVGLDVWQAAGGGKAFTGLTGMNNPDAKVVGDDAPSLFVRARGKAQRFLTVLEPRKGPSAVQAIEAVRERTRFGVLVHFSDGSTSRVLFAPSLQGPAEVRVEY